MPVRPRLRGPGALIALALLSGVIACASGPRRPLFVVGNPTPAQPQTRVLSTTQLSALQGPVTLGGGRSFLTPEVANVPSSSPTREEIDQLVAHLRDARGEDRVRVVERIVKAGALSPEDLKHALDDARFEADLLSEAETRLSTAPRTDAPTAPTLGAGGDRKRSVAAPWIEDKYRLALERYLNRDYLGSIAIVEAILALEPNPIARPKLERLRRRSRERLIQDTVIATRIVPDELALAPGKPLRAHVLLENRSHDPLVLKAAAGAPLGLVALDYEELVWDGTRTLRRSTRAVPGDRELRLAPGDRLEVALDLPTEHQQKEPGVVGRYRLSGRLRPGTLLSGEEPLPYFLPLFEVFVFVVDPEDRDAVLRPRETFEESIAAVHSATNETAAQASRRRAFAAALVWAAQDRDAACAALVAALEPSTGALSKMLSACLARATGEPGSFSKEEWLTWWTSAQSRPHAAHHKAGDPHAGDVEDDSDGGENKTPR